MAPRNNPLNLNPLQLRTLTLFKALATLDGHARPGPGEGEITITNLPLAHGDHFHLGKWVVLGRDATGMKNMAVWVALQRKGLMRGQFPDNVVLTPSGLAYDTSLAGAILHAGDH